MTHFVPHYAVIALIIAAIALVLGMRLPATLAAAVAVFFAVEVWMVASTGAGAADAYRASPAANAREASPSPAVTVMTFNMFDRNPHTDALRGWLVTRPANVVTLQEVPATFAAALRADDGYPYQISVFDPGLDGARFPEARSITILSVFPIVEAIKLKPSPEGQAAALVRLAVSSAGELWVAVVDTVEPPLTPQRLAARDLYLLGVAERVARHPGPLIVTGDFNATPYAPVFKAFLSIANVRLTGVLAGTWPHWLGPLGLRLDHILVRGLELEHIRILDVAGSDHRAVRAVLRQPNESLFRRRRNLCPPLRGQQYGGRHADRADRGKEHEQPPEAAGRVINHPLEPDAQTADSEC